MIGPVGTTRALGEWRVGQNNTLFTLTAAQLGWFQCNRRITFTSSLTTIIPSSTTTNLTTIGTTLGFMIRNITTKGTTASLGGLLLLLSTTATNFANRCFLIAPMWSFRGIIFVMECRLLRR
jgi:hypothetical protein